MRSLRVPLFDQRSRSKDRSSCEFEQELYICFTSEDFEFYLNRSTMPNTRYLVRSLILSVFLQLRIISSRFYGKNILWSGQISEPREVTRDLSVSPKILKFQFKRKFRCETSEISRLDLCKC